MFNFIYKIGYFILLGHWFIFRLKTFGVKCVIKFENEILMVKHTYGEKDNWMFPGGRIRRKETAEQAVKREIFEEIGIQINNLKKVGEYSSAKEFKKDTIIVFQAKSDTKDIQIDNKEIKEARWFKLDDLPKISEYSKKILTMLSPKNDVTINS